MYLINYSNVDEVFTTTTLLDASRTWMTGSEYLGSILTAVCCFEVVAPPIKRGILRSSLSISLAT